MQIPKIPAAALAFTLAVFSQAGCTGALTYQVRGSDVSAGSDAKLVADIDTGKHVTRLHIDGTNITPPERIIDGATLFVAWARKNSSVQWTRLGALNYDATGRRITGELTFSLTSFDFIVSIEKAPDAESPSGKTIFIQRIN
jgi:hypothetical protein